MLNRKVPRSYSDAKKVRPYDGAREDVLLGVKKVVLTHTLYG